MYTYADNNRPGICCRVRMIRDVDVVRWYPHEVFPISERYDTLSNVQNVKGLVSSCRDIHELKG